jgi:hypothetical protein
MPINIEIRLTRWVWILLVPALLGIGTCSVLAFAVREDKAPIIGDTFDFAPAQAPEDAALEAQIWRTVAADGFVSLYGSNQPFAQTIQHYGEVLGAAGYEAELRYSERAGAEEYWFESEAQTYCVAVSPYSSESHLDGIALEPNLREELSSYAGSYVVDLRRC